MPLLSRPVPSTISTLNPGGFLFSVQKFPELTYFIQESPLPGVELGQAIQASSVHDIKVPGETLTFDDIQISFLVDENMDNYQAIFGWLIGLGYPEGHYQFREWQANLKNANAYSKSDAARTVSDCHLSILNSDNIPIFRYTFVDAFPVALSGLTFQSTNTDVQYLVANLTLAYSYYTVSSVALPGSKNGIWLSLKGNRANTNLNSIASLQNSSVNVSIRGTFSKSGVDGFYYDSAPYGSRSHNSTVGISGIQSVSFP
jgi:hypothetical protein